MTVTCPRLIQILYFALALAGSLPLAATDKSPLIALLLDTSGSIRNEDLSRTRSLALDLFSNLPPGSEMAIFAFNDSSQKILDRTADPDKIENVLRSLTVAGTHTALYDALFDASQYLRAQPASQKVIVLLTDGKDENSAVKLEDGLKLAMADQVPVLAIGVGTRVQEQALRRTAKLTGGQYVPLSQARGYTLARWIRPVGPDSPPAPPPSPHVAPASSSSNVPARAKMPHGRLVFFFVWGLALLVSLGLALLYLGRRRRAPDRPNPDETTVLPSASPPAAPAVAGLSTVLLALPVDKTQLLELKQGTLVVLQGPGIGHVFSIGRHRPTLLGRDPQADVPLADPAVSGQHCRISPGHGAYLLQDLESTNGTSVNEIKVSQHVLRDGDRLHVGGTLLEFRLEG